MRSRRLVVPALAVVVGGAVIAADVLGAGRLVTPYMSVALMAAGILTWAVATRRPEPRFPWLCVAIAVDMWVFADLAWELLIDSPLSPWVELIYFGGYAVLLVGLASCLRRQAYVELVDTVIDLALIVVSGFLLVWELLIEPAQADGPLTATDVAIAAYPLLDLIVLVVMLRIIYAHGRSTFTSTCMVLAMSAIFVADVAYGLFAESYLSGWAGEPALNTAWLTGYFLFAASSLHPDVSEFARPARRPTHRGQGSLVVAGGALLGVPMIEAISHVTGRHEGNSALTWSIVALLLAPLVLWRIVRMTRFNERARVELARRRDYFRGVALHASDAFIVIEPSTTVRDASSALTEILGYEPDEVVGAPATSVVATADRDGVEGMLKESIANPQATVTREARVRTAHGGWIWVELRCTNLLDDPSLHGIVINLHDITSRKQAESDLAHQAFHDSLTGLANRALFRDRLEHALALRRRSGQELMVAFCDLDGFKAINDSIGHDAGDVLLRVIAGRLRGAVRPSDTVARLGGDEFAVLLEGPELTFEDAAAVADRMLDAMCDPVDLDDTPVIVTGSIGIVAASDLGQPTAVDMLRDADAAMYRAKANGRNQVVRYEPTMRAAALDAAQLEVDLRGAAQRNELRLRFHPVVDLTRGEIVAFEALVRWDHPTRGFLSPDAFIPLSERSGSILEIGRWVLDEACDAAVRLQHATGNPDLMIGVNISAHQLAAGDLRDRIASALDRSGLPPSRLVIELTESALVEDPDAVARQLDAIKSTGVILAIDDFGVGFSSLSRLRQFSVDILKIDQSFVNGVTAADRVPAILHGLLELSRTLGLLSVAEGIETPAQYEALRREGCQFGQGYLFAQPMAEDAVVRHVRTASAATLDPAC